MCKVLVFSDSHGNIQNMTKAIENFKEKVDTIIHLGDYVEDIENKLINIYKDKHFLYVAGNNDFMSKIAPEEKIVNINNNEIFLTHGHQYNVYFGIDKLYYRLEELNIKIGLYGHTHKPLACLENDILILNPGSISAPRGFSVCTFLLIDFSEEITYKFYGIFDNTIKEIK